MSLNNEIKLSLTKALDDDISKTVLDKAGKSLEKEILKLIWERTAAGYDMHGKRWRRYKAERWMKGRGYVNYGVYKKSLGLSQSDWLILKGDLKRGTFCKYLRTDQNGANLLMTFNLYVDTENEKKAEGLMSNTGYDRNGNTYPKSDYKFLGLSDSGSYMTIERQRIGTVLAKIIKENVKSYKVKNNV